MKFSEDSFFYKITYLNDIAIIATSTIIGGLLIFYVVNTLNNNLKNLTENSLRTLKINYETEKKELEEDAAKMSNTQEVYRAMNHGKIQK
ncbi:MAG: hypothetical protein ACQERZ_06825, partial [Fusobacteriota bacterium]